MLLGAGGGGMRGVEPLIEALRHPEKRNGSHQVCGFFLRKRKDTKVYYTLDVG